MVTVFLRGGLGNQMFQYAAGLSVAKRSGSKLTVDTTYLNDRFPRREFAYRTYDLGVFELPQNFTNLSKISSALPVPGMWLGIDLVLMQVKHALHVQTIIKEKEARGFDPGVLKAKGNVLLWGRWQTEKYFSDAVDEVRRAFTFKNGLTGEAARLAEEIRATNSVSLHVRRGDYAAFKSVEELHGKTDLSYYTRAAAHTASRVKNPRFFVFSDDVAWCRANLSLDFPMTFVDQDVAGPHDSFHLELMSLCKHNIITNSTFSWWGAWLNKNPQKIVIAPARWYADAAHLDDDIIPRGWVKM